MATPERVFPGRVFFEGVYAGRAPWDIEAPQPALIDLVTRFPPPGVILDLGCGTGDLAIGLARRGFAVLGVDFVAAAIDVARQRALALPEASRGLVDFEVGDALRPSRYADRIHSIVDSGFYHLFDPPVREALVRELAIALPPGGRYYQLGFAVALPADDVPKQITTDEIERLFRLRDGWLIRALEPAAFKAVGFAEIPSLALCAERLPNAEPYGAR